jgi:hypothetical protein
MRITPLCLLKSNFSDTIVSCSVSVPEATDFFSIENSFEDIKSIMKFFSL